MGKSLEVHGRDHRPGGSDPIPVVLHIKIFTDTTTVAAGDGARYFFVTKDLAGLTLLDAQAGVTTAGGALSIMVRNVTQGNDMLSTAITIDSGEETSYTAATSSVVNKPFAKVDRGDKIAIDVDTASGSGLEAFLTFWRKTVD